MVQHHKGHILSALQSWDFVCTVSISFWVRNYNRDCKCVFLPLKVLSDIIKTIHLEPQQHAGKRSGSYHVGLFQEWLKVTVLIGMSRFVLLFRFFLLLFGECCFGACCYIIKGSCYFVISVYTEVINLMIFITIKAQGSDKAACVHKNLIDKCVHLKPWLSVL